MTLGTNQSLDPECASFGFVPRPNQVGMRPIEVSRFAPTDETLVESEIHHLRIPTAGFCQTRKALG